MDFSKLMEQAQQMQESLQKAQSELAEKIYEGNAQGVIVKLKGTNEVVEVNIPNDMISIENKEMLEDLLLIAFNNAVDQMLTESEEKIGAATGGMQIPGL